MFMNKDKFRTHVKTAFNMNNSLLKITSADSGSSQDGNND